MLACPGCCFVLPIFGFAILLGRRSLVGKLWGQSCWEKRLAAGAFAAHGQAWGRLLGVFRIGLGCPSGRPGLWRRGLGGAMVCGTGVRSRSPIRSAAANRVLCSRRLYIVQSGQRRKTGYVKGGND